MGLFGVGWLFLAASDRSLTALLAAYAMLVHALGLVAGGPLADAFFLLDLAAAVFGVSALMYYASRGASVTTLSDESPISPGPKRPLPQR